MKALLILTLNDLAVAFKNKTVYLLLFIPFFVYGSLAAVDRPGARAARLGLVHGVTYPAGVVPAIQAAGQQKVFAVTWLPSEAEGRRQVQEKTLDGVLLPGAVLLVAKRESLATVALVEGLSRLQRVAESHGTPDWVGRVESLSPQTGGLQSQTLPIWILMLVLLVGLLVLPPQVAEEKEKKVALGVLQTPVTEGQWLTAKVLCGTILAVLPVLLLHAVSRVGLGDVPSYLVFLVAGGFCFSSVGVLLGFLCRTQASARALGVLVYLPHLLPSALGEFSRSLSRVAGFIPSDALFSPLRAILAEGATAAAFLPQLAFLLVLGLACGFASLALLHRRWLM